jgi:hypothetical protein
VHKVNSFGSVQRFLHFERVVIKVLLEHLVCVVDAELLK